MREPIILCGLGQIGWRVLEYLVNTGMSVTVIDEDPATDPRDARLKRVKHIRGDFRLASVLEEAGIRTAAGIIIVTSDDLLNLHTALTARQLNADTRIVLRMFNRNLLARLGKSLPNVYALSVSALSAPVIAMTAITGEVLGGFTVGSEQRQIVECFIQYDSPWKGKRIAELKQSGYQILSLTTMTETGKSGLMEVIRKKLRGDLPGQIIEEIEPNKVLSEGDHLVVCGEPHLIQELISPEKPESSVYYSWRLLRWFRTFRTFFREMDLAVKICTSLLILTLTISMTVYHFGMGLSWPDGLYRTVSVIATTSDMRGDNYDSSWQKVFISILRVTGTALIAAFTAILTNYLIRARLGSVFEVSKVPESGHIIICGLGNVGYRVAEELQRSHQEVIIIEKNADNPFVSTSRRSGIPVFIGDASIEQTLRQANFSHAKAIVACTSDDLMNLEIALLIHEMSPDLRVVVRFTDPIMADTMRQTGGVELALSTSELAAPAFVAGILGDEVRSMFKVGEEFVLILEVLINEARKSLVGASVKELGKKNHFVPLAVVDAENKIRQMTDDLQLQPQDRLVISTTWRFVQAFLTGINADTEMT